MVIHRIKYISTNQYFSLTKLYLLRFTFSVGNIAESNNILYWNFAKNSSICNFDGWTDICGWTNEENYSRKAILVTLFILVPNIVAMLHSLEIFSMKYQHWLNKSFWEVFALKCQYYNNNDFTLEVFAMKQKYCKNIGSILETKLRNNSCQYSCNVGKL